MKYLESLKISNLNLKTRIIMPPMATSKSKDGMIGEDLCSYYYERALNPLISLIINIVLFSLI